MLKSIFYCARKNIEGLNMVFCVFLGRGEGEEGMRKKQNNPRNPTNFQNSK